MMKKIFILALTLLSFAGCGKNDSPSAVAEKAVGYIQDGKYEKYVDLMYVKEDADLKQVEKNKEMMVSLLQNKFEKTKEKNGGIQSYEILSEDVQDSTAVVHMKIVYGNGDEKEDKISLRKNNDGDWKIDQHK